MKSSAPSTELEELRKWILEEDEKNKKQYDISGSTTDYWARVRSIQLMEVLAKIDEVRKRE